MTTNNRPDYDAWTENDPDSAALGELDTTLRHHAAPGLALIAKYIRRIKHTTAAGLDLAPLDRGMLIGAVRAYPANMTETTDPERENETLETACSILIADAEKRGVNAPAIMQGCKALQAVYHDGSFSPVRSWPDDLTEDDWRKIPEIERSILRRFAEDLRLVVTTARQQKEPEGNPIDTEENVFSRTGEFWTVRYQGTTLPPIRHRAGMTYISELLVQRGKPVPATKLYEAENPPPPEAVRNDRENDRSLSDEYGTGGGRRDGFDAKAVKQIQDVIADRESQLEDPAISGGDAARIEIEIKQLRAAIRQGQNPIEDRNTRNPRTAVKNAVDRAMQAIIVAGGQNLADHLKTIQTGNESEYTGGLFWKI